MIVFIIIIIALIFFFIVAVIYSSDKKIAEIDRQNSMTDIEKVLNLIQNGFEFKFLETQIQIFDVEYSSTRNSRVGMSIGANFKPRVYLTGSAKAKMIRNVNQKFVISLKNDKLDIRSREILSMYFDEVTDSMTAVLTSKIINEAKAERGNNYILKVI